MKQFFIIIAFLHFSIGHAQTKSHNTKCMHCRFSKDYVNPESKPKDGNQGRASNECVCAACGETRQKEKAARQAEDKRREIATAARIKAEREAKQIAFEKEQQKKRDEAKAKEIAEANQKKRTEELRAKYAALADKSKVRMSGQQLQEVGYIEDVKEYADDKKRIYGLKFQETVAVEIPYPEGVNYIRVNRLWKSNYFMVSPMDSNANVTNAHIIDMFGNKVIIDGDEFIYERCNHDENNNSITVYKINSGFAAHGDELVGGADESGAMDFVDSMDGVDAHYNRMLNGDFRGLGFGYKVFYAAATAYVLDYNMKIQEKKSGMIIQHSKRKPTY